MTGDPAMQEGQPDALAMFAPNLFAGTTALVTGGGRGMGKAAAMGFARYGANVVIASNEPAELEEVAAEIEAAGVGCLQVDVNIRDTTSVDRLRDQSLERFGAVDFVINNGWRSVVDLNLNGTWNMCSRFMPHLMERQRGAIVNIVHIYSFERGAPMFTMAPRWRSIRSLAPYLEARNVT